MNNFFKLISGKPKNGNISECLYLSRFMTTFLMAVVGQVLGLASANYGGDYESTAILFAIATVGMCIVGWVMSNKRFDLYESSLKEEQNGAIKDFIRPYIFVTQLMICVIIDLIGQYYTIDIVKYIIFFISMFLAWQCGWGMDIVKVNSAGEEITNN